MDPITITAPGEVAWIIPKDAYDLQDQIVYEEPDPWSYTEDVPFGGGECRPKKLRKVVIFEVSES